MNVSQSAIPSRILYIDLTSHTFHIKEEPELFRKWIGGTGVAMQVLERELPRSADPLGPENRIVLAIGTCTALYPLASKCVAMFKSPLTGNLGESHAGGRTAISLRSAGYGAIVIWGRSEKPIYLSITPESVVFKDARTLWGMGRSDKSARIIRSHDGSPGTRTILRIGRAGENLVRFASVTSETFRHFGRLGLGAVFGSKNLKALVISGDDLIPVADAAAYRKMYDTIYTTVTESPLMKKYHNLGTPVNILPLSSLGSLPVKNLTEKRLQGAENLSGESLAERFLTRRVACAHCPVSCIHIAQVRTPYPNDPYFYKTTSVCYDYELIYALGFMLGIADPEQVLLLIDEIERTGMDAISSGVLASWATEAMQNGLISEEMTGGIRLTFGDVSGYHRFFSALADQKSQFFLDLGKGTEFAAEKYGGSSYALSFGKNEMAGYHTGPASYIGFICGSRHSHLDGAGYSIDQKDPEKRGSDPEKIAAELFEEESWRQILSSLAICFFSRAVYTPELVSACLKISGISYSPEELLNLGRMILRQKYQFKKRDGFSLEAELEKIPGRIFETPSGEYIITKEEISTGVLAFKKIIEGEIRPS